MAISFVKSLSLKSSSPTKRGYANRITQPDTVSDTEDDEDSPSLVAGDVSGYVAADRDVAFNVFDCRKGVSAYKPVFGGPFSMLTPSMWPQDILAALDQPEDSQPPYQFDEFGFIIESDRGKDMPSSGSPENGETDGEDGEDGEDGVEGDTEGEDGEDDEGLREESRMITSKQTEEELRTKWIAFLEFNYNEDASPGMKWSQVEAQMRHTKVLDGLVKSGLPQSMRPQLWMRFSKGMTLKSNSKWSYAQMCDLSNHVQPLSEKQILRVLPMNACFMKTSASSAIGIERLRRILRVIKWLQRSGSNAIQASNESVNIAIIAAYLLLVSDEEDAFWLTLSCVNELKSFDHQSILKELISQHCPQIDGTLKENDIEISLITLHWFSSLFSGFIPKTSLLFLFWDLYFYYGSIVLFQLAIGLLMSPAIKETLTGQVSDSAAIFNALSDLPSHVKDNVSFLSFWLHGQNLVHHIKSDAHQLSSKQGLTPATSLLSLPSFTNETTNENDIRSKNVRQTSILMELHDAIIAIGRHFEAHDPAFKALLFPDYSNIDRYDDEDEVNETQHPRKRRAKALIDFQRHDPDELGFRRNDVITIVSERDEHCWVGELNGLRGWFPAKFVELLDERTGDYSVAGDDRVVPFINDLVRGRLCNDIKAVLTYGLKKTLFIAVHPWNIVETIASACIESDFNSVYSRLVLTRTFRLDEFARVLTPSEMLYRSIAHINQTHEHEVSDVKLRSLVCVALNQQILHDWFTVICAMQPHILAKYYHNWSYVNSPVFRLIKAELRLLTQFTFNLNPNAELAEASQPQSPVSKDGVRDMLVKHHLFSWDI